MFIGRRRIHNLYMYQCENIGHDIVYHSRIYHGYHRFNKNKSGEDPFEFHNSKSFQQHFNNVDAILKPYYSKINYSDVDDEINARKLVNAFILFNVIHENGRLFDLNKWIEEFDERDIIRAEDKKIKSKMDKYNIRLDDIKKELSV